MDGIRVSAVAATREGSETGARRSENGLAATNVAEAGRCSSPVKTFWTFHGPEMIPERFSNSSATDVPADWCILHHEARQVVVVARRTECSVNKIKTIAPNLAHWAKDDLQGLLDRCPSSGEPDRLEPSVNLDRLGRRKRPSVAYFVDNLMAERLGFAVETIRTYRRRGA